MAYTTIDKPSDYFNTKLYTGTGSSHAITGVGFAPNWVWIKHRDEANPHKIFDTVRGVGKSLKSNSSDAQASNEENGYVSAFGSDGFTVVGGSTSSNDVNKSSGTYVAWNWKAGTSFTNDASSTGIGSIDSAGSVNTDAGFSIVSYTGNSPNATTIKHGLNSIPQMIIFKRLVGAGNFTVYHQSLGNTKGIFLTTTAASDTSAGYFNNTTPTSSVFSVANSGDTNSNGNAMIAYCFAEKKGYSKFGSYTGNGNADGPFFYTGFKPAFIIQKRSDATHDWQLHDNKRGQYFPGNVVNNRIQPNSNSAEGTGDDIGYDFLSNGFKTRTSNANYNASGSVYIYMAFAENPFVTSTGVPATAR